MINDLTNGKKLPGGVGDNTPSHTVDPIQLSLGVQIEMEHTNDSDIAQEIAMDHLTENPLYYTKLIKAGLAKEFQPSHNSGFGDPDQSFNDSARLGKNTTCTPGNNVVGTIGGTPNGKVDGRNSEPIVNKTIDIELQERKKKIRRIIKKMREGSTGNGVDKNPIQVFDGPSPAETSPEGLGTFGSGYDFVGYAESKNMKQERLNEIIKALARKQLREQDEMNADQGPETETPESPEGMDTPETGAAEEEQVTITLDRPTAQKLHDLLMQVLQPAGAESGDGEDAPTETDDQLPPEGNEGEGSELGEITFEQSMDIGEAKEKWIKKAINKKGALHKQMNVPKGEKIPKDKLAAAAKKGGKLGQRARLAMTLSKLKKK